MVKISRHPKDLMSLFGMLVIPVVLLLLLTTQPALGQTNAGTAKLSLTELGYSTEVLVGPSGEAHYYFSLPANWSPQAGTYLQLDLAYAVTNKTGIAPALLEVRLNGTVLRTTSFSGPKATSLKIEIPPEALRLAEEANVNDLNLRLSVQTRCEEAQLTTLTIQPSSTLAFVYQEQPLNPDLAFYPKPLYYSRAFEATSARMVFPPQPDASELTSAALIAANLGAQTRNNLALEASLGPTLPITATQEHLVVVGSPERATLLSELTLPVPVHQRQMDLRSQMPAAVASTHPFSYILIVKNTSTSPQSLTVEDRLSPLVSIEACQGCDQVMPGLLRWDIGALGSGQTISTTVQARPGTSISLDEPIEHTASLLNADGQVINVDTLTTTLALETSETMVSSSTKGPYFFSLGSQGVPENDGIVQMIVSPWNAERAVIAVTGLDDAAVLRAAHALATRDQMPGMRGQFAIVQATRPTTVDLSFPASDATLAELGYANNIVVVGRADETRLIFEISRGTTLAEEAYLAAHWAHGTAFNAISATLELSLNGTPINSIELRPDNESDNWTKAPLPPRSLKAGRNELRVRITATKWPDCLDADALARFWVTVYSDSYLHLPLQQTPGQHSPFDLADYPQFLVTQASLNDVAVLLPEQITSDEAQGMVQLFSLLGNVSRGKYFAPQVALGSQAAPDRWRDYNLIVIGRPTQNPYIALVNDQLPQPFIPGQDEIQQQIDNVIYRWPPGFDLGYIQLLPVPWASNHAMLVVTGTTDEGLRWSLRSLTNGDLSRQLRGNLAVLVTETGLRATDTRQAAVADQSLTVALKLTPPFAATPGATLTPTLAAISATPESAVTPTATYPPPATSSPQTGGETQALGQGRPFWLIPLLGLSLLVVIVAVGVTVWQARA
jgi:hypothetical protein